MVPSASSKSLRIGSHFGPRAHKTHRQRELLCSLNLAVQYLPYPPALTECAKLGHLWLPCSLTGWGKACVWTDSVSSQPNCCYGSRAQSWDTDVTSLPPAISAPDQLPGVLRDWKEHGASCPLALPVDHTVPHLSEQKWSTSSRINSPECVGNAHMQIDVGNGPNPSPLWWWHLSLDH